ncbi:MAG TPA: helix-turn-helix transcriptional regulator [Lachnospiraceae bacterium]|nr:helix-turn-helix transcriptional regulator [Lachnospiraceae bacterium]
MNQLLVAIRLSDLRKEKNWTQEELSTRLHVTRQAISKWENGITLPNL